VEEFLNNKEIFEKQISDSDFKNITESEHVESFVLFGDNITECLSVINQTISHDYCKFIGVHYEYLHVPIFVYKFKNIFFVIKVCGFYDRWVLPETVFNYINYHDLPDIVFYSINDQKILFAAELTETASVGNSELQRDGRRVAAAKLGIPFIYQTFYSGYDKSQEKIREVTSKISYSSLLYTSIYETPSLVLYLENPNKKHRVSSSRSYKTSENFVGDYLLLSMINKYDEANYFEELIIKFLESAIEYLIEDKVYRNKNHVRISSPEDLPMVSVEVSDVFRNKILRKQFMDDLIDLAVKKTISKEDFYKKYPLTKYDLKADWKSKIQKSSKSGPVKFLDKVSYDLVKNSRLKALTNFSGFKVGVIKTSVLVEYLESNFKNFSKADKDSLNQYDETIIFPTRLHKTDKKKGLLFSKDPESGELAHFTQLMAIDPITKKKTRGIFGPVIKIPPKDFSLEDKKYTALYRSLYENMDLLMMNKGTEFVITSNLDPKIEKSEIIKDSDVHMLTSFREKKLHEENALVTVFIKSKINEPDIFNCYFATSHSSWQTTAVKNAEIIDFIAMGRDSSHLDMVLQLNELFLLAEGKKSFNGFTTGDEPKKIAKAFKNTKKKISKTYNEDPAFINLFICLDENNDDKIKDSVKNNEFKKMTSNEEYAVITVNPKEKYNNTKIFFTDNFDPGLKNKMNNLLENIA